METVLIILACLCAVVGIAGCILPALPGPPICFVGLLLAMWGGMDVSTHTLIWAAVVTVFVTVADYCLPVWFTRRFGGSKHATHGAMAGIVVGLFFMPAGLVLGPFLGALAGELMYDRNDFGKALKVAFGSFAAFIFGTGLKLVAAVWMTVLTVKGLF